MTKNRSKPAIALVVLGAALFILTALASGLSAFFTTRTDSISQLNEFAGEQSGGLYRPFYEMEFDAVTFSGLYLAGEEDKPAVWVMEAVRQGDEKICCFFVAADGEDFDGDGVFDENDAPQDEWDVSYILRAARPAYAEHIDSMLDDLAADTAAYYGLDESEVRDCYAGIFEASRNDRIVARVGLAAGFALLLAGVVLLLARDILSRKPCGGTEDEFEDEAAAGEEQPDGSEEAYEKNEEELEYAKDDDESGIIEPIGNDIGGEDGEDSGGKLGQ